MSSSHARPWRITASGLALEVRLTPKGGRDAIDGVETLSNGLSVLRIRVRVAAREGEANDALIRLLARSLGVAPRDVVITGGATARLKRLTIAGDGPTLAAALEKTSGLR